MKFAQHLQNDKVYHQKEGKISYLMVYLVNLSSTCPGPAQFLLDYMLIQSVYNLEKSGKTGKVREFPSEWKSQGEVREFAKYLWRNYFVNFPQFFFIV